jgi:hypothetical protein
MIAPAICLLKVKAQHEDEEIVIQCGFGIYDQGNI